MELDLNDPNLDFAGQSDVIARALRMAQEQQDMPMGGPQFHGKWNTTGNGIATALTNALGQYGVKQAEGQQTALNKEQISRFDAIAKQLGTPGTKRGKVLSKTLSGDQQGPEQMVDGDVPLDPIEENQRQMGLGMQMSKLPMANKVGMEFIKSGVGFPEKMATLQSQQEQAKMLLIQRSQDRMAEIQTRLEDKALDRDSREALAREGFALREQIAGMTKTLGNANADIQRELIQARIDKLKEPKPPSKESAAAEKARHESAMGVASIDDAIKELDNPKAKNAMGARNILPDAVRQYTDPNGVVARATVANIGSLKLHDRSGAAITASEFPRLKPFIPSMTDKVEAVKNKLGKMREEYLRMQGEWAKSRGATDSYPPEGSGPADPAPSRKVYNPATGRVE